MLASDLIVWKLKQDEDVASFVGDRIYPLNSRDTALPCIQYKASGYNLEASHEGRSKTEAVAITVYMITDSYQDSDDLLEAVMLCLEATSGLWMGDSDSAVEVLGCYSSQDLDEDSNIDPANNRINTILKSLTFNITYIRG